MVNVCPRIKASLESDSPPLDLTSVFLERIILDKYYEQYWLSSDSAKELNIALEGELYFDPKLREFLDLDDDTDESGDDNLQVELKENLQGRFKKVSLDSFNEKYGDQAETLRQGVDRFKQISIRD